MSNRKRASNQRARYGNWSSLHARFCLLAALAIAALALPSTVLAAAGPASGDGVVPTEELGNVTCPTGLFELKTDNPEDQVLSDGTLSVTLDFKNSGSGEILDWKSNIGVDQVIVKGGPNGNAYVYVPEDNADTSLHTPINPNNGKYFDVSHVTFCYDVELVVTKTANTSFTRDFDWQIKKTNDAPSPVQLAPGQAFSANYEVTAGVVKYADSGWAATGEITIENPAQIAANGVSVEDVIEKAGDADVEAEVDCNGETEGTGLPATIPAGDTLTCTYTASLPDGSERTNKATATSTTPGIGAGSGTAKVVFGSPSEEIDECVTVSDDNVTPEELGEVCAGDSPKTFKYALEFGPFANECKTHEFTNTASFVTNDNEETGSAESVVKVEVQCIPEGGCSLTQGYWKTHSELGPAPYDDTWALLAKGAGTPFFNSGKTWHQAFWTPPSGGNAYWILAHQYQAAVLNELNGASVPANVAAAIKEAATYLANYPANNNPKGKTRTRMQELAGLLASYNEGTIGPGHCSEDKSSSSSA